MSFDRASVRALTFDVFGTVVDWRSSVIDEGRALGARLGLQVDWPAFADAWRAGYPPAMDEVRSGALPWMDIDALHRRILERLLAERGLVLPEAEAVRFNLVWHRLRAWPDSAAGLAAMRSRLTLCTLSNGNLSLLADLAECNALPFHHVLSAELFRHYKPDPEVYLGAAAHLGLSPSQVMMVAAHPSDLRAAAACGLRTAYVARPDENGPGGAMAPWTPGEFDIAAADFGDLARQLLS